MAEKPFLVDGLIKKDEEQEGRNLKSRQKDLIFTITNKYDKLETCNRINLIHSADEATNNISSGGGEDSDTQESQECNDWESL